MLYVLYRLENMIRRIDYCLLIFLFLFVFTILHFGYRLNSYLPLGVLSEYFYRTWDLYQTIDDGFVAFIVRLFVNYPTLQPSFHPVLGVLFLALTKGNPYIALFLQSFFYASIAVIFVYFFARRFVSSYISTLFTATFISFYFVMRFYLAYNIEAGVVGWGLGAVFFLTSSTSKNEIKYYLVLLFLFLLALWRPIDGALLSWGMLNFNSFYEYFKNKHISKLEIIATFLFPFFFLPAFFWESTNPNYPYYVLFTQLFITAILLLIAVNASQRRRYIVVAQGFFWGAYFIIFAPVVFKFRSWFSAGEVKTDISFLETISKLFLSISAEHLHLGVFCYWGMCFAAIIFGVIKFRDQLSILIKPLLKLTNLFFFAPFLMSCLGALFLKNPAPNYHYLGLILLVLFFWLGFIHMWSKCSLFLSTFLIVVLIVNFLDYFSYKSLSFSFEGPWQNRRAQLTEMNCMFKKVEDLGLKWVSDMNPYVFKGKPSRIWLLGSNETNYFFINDFRTKYFFKSDEVDSQLMPQGQPFEPVASDLVVVEHGMSHLLPSKFISELEKIKDFWSYSSSCERQVWYSLFKFKN